MMSEEMKNQQTEMLIRFYNMQAGTAYRVGKQENREAVSGAIDRADGDIVAIKNFVREWASAHKDEEVSVIDCFDAFEAEKPEEVAEAPAPAPSVSQTEMNAKTAMDFLGAAVVDIIAKTKVDEIKETILGRCEDKVREFIAKEYGTTERSTREME